MAEARAPSIFLSHSSEDKPRVRQLATLLKARGVEVWIDEHDGQAGAFLPEQLADGVYDSDFVLIAISRHSLTSGWVKYEYNLAIHREVTERRTLLIPVLLDRHAEVPRAIRGRLWIDMSTEKLLNDNLSVLLRAIGAPDVTGFIAPSEPASLVLFNGLAGPILFIRIRACGTDDWGGDLLPNDPVEGTIQPGHSRTILVPYPGCWDIQLQHLDAASHGLLQAREHLGLVVNASTERWVVAS